MAYPTGVFAFLDSIADTNRRYTESAAGTLIAPRIVVFLDLARGLLERVSAGETLLVSPSGDVNDAVVIERISAFGQPEDDRLAAVARLASRPDRAISGAALRDTLLDNGGDLGDALTRLLDRPVIGSDIDVTETDRVDGIGPDEARFLLNESEYVQLHHDRRFFGDSMCKFLRIC
ncbi:hypothetical protein [Nocardia aurea]|uniref:Uncharacterized protein n=1 Tax=Nocardia aurea TaxID=2144174 RepID=A0ABV3G5F9_9NOCA